MSIENTFDWNDLPTHTIEPQEATEYLEAPYDDAHIALETFHAYDEGYLAEVPWALEAYLDHDQHREGR